MEKYIIETDKEKLLDNPGGNLKALNSFHLFYAYNNKGSPEFWKILVEMFEDELPNKKYTLDVSLVVSVI